MAWKMVLMQMIIVILTSWMISRDYEWKFDWIYQVVGLAGFVFLGWLSFAAINMLVTVDSLGLLVRISVHSLLYSVLSGMVIWTLPWLAGMTREGLMSNIAFVLTPNKMK